MKHRCLTGVLRVSYGCLTGVLRESYVPDLIHSRPRVQLTMAIMAAADGNHNTHGLARDGQATTKGQKTAAFDGNNKRTPPSPVTMLGNREASTL